MRKTLLWVLAAGIVIGGGMLADRVAAMPLAAPADGGASIQRVAILCGGMGCAPVQTKQMQRRKFQPLGYTRPLPQAPQQTTILPPKS